MKSTHRFKIHEFEYRPYATLNHSVLNFLEVESIADWCEENNCVYYGTGIVEFPDKETLTLFLLRWA